MKKNKLQAYTLRPDDTLDEYIRYSYERYRQLQLVDKRPMPSMNEYLCLLITKGINTASMEAA